MLHISILGAGNLAYHLAKRISQIQGVNLLQIYNRSPFSFHFDSFKQAQIGNLSELLAADIYIICIKDEEIATFSTLLPLKNQFVVHTSGNTPMEVLADTHRKGVLYPVQSFSKEKEIAFSQIPLCLEAQHPSDYALLEDFAKKLSPLVYKMSSQQRKQLHIGAVFANNFANHLWYISEKHCQKHDIDFRILRPLLQETYQKTLQMSFYEAQTGPARRADTITIEKHLSLLDGIDQQIYKILTQSILQAYEKC